MSADRNSVSSLPEVAPSRQTMPDTPNVVARQEPPVQKHTPPAPEVSASVIKPLNREAQLSQMVDDLVGPDEDDIVLKALPGNIESEKIPSSGPGYKSKAPLRGLSPRAFQAVRTPELRTEAWQLPLSPTGVPSQRLNSVSNIWNDAPVRETSPITPFGSAPPGLPPILTSARRSNAHSRVNSTNSVRSPLPQTDAMSSFEPTPNPYNNIGARGDRYQSFSGHYAGMQSPLLFGAGTSPWSTGPRKSVPNITPPNGQGG
jgi:hypothetical protein